MLSINASTDAEGAKRYFRENLSQADYLGEKSTVIGQWYGKTAEMLGLNGDVKAKDFENLIDNIRPDTGGRLTPRNSPKRRNMYDCTFSVCKSVSILAAMHPDKQVREEIRAGFFRSVQKTLDKMESDIRTQTGQGKQKTYPKTGNLLAALFTHDTTRPLKIKNDDGKTIYVPDPNLHIHAELLNATYYEAEDRLRAIEMGPIKTTSPYYEALMHSYMGQELRAMGFELQREGKRWEIAGIDKELRDKFSGRTIEIEKIAAIRNIKSAKSKSELGRMTRHKKDKSVADSLLPELWDKRLSDEDRKIIESSKGENKSLAGEKEKGLNPEIALDMSFSHFLERQSVFPKARALGMAIDLTSGEIDPEVIEAEFGNRGDVIDATESHVEFITLQQAVQEEKALIERAVAGRGEYAPVNRNYTITNDIFNEDQKKAIQHTLNSRDQIVLVSGDAGTGKTTIMKSIKEGIEESGKQLHAYAPSADASRGQLRDKGFKDANTVTKLINDPLEQEKLQDQWMLIDELGTVGIPTFNKILDIADERNCRIIGSGDWKQHNSIERGDCMRIMEQYSELPVARIQENVRQRKNPQYKEIVQDFARGIDKGDKTELRQTEVKKAFNKLDKQGHIVEEIDLSKRHEMIADAYLKASEKSHRDVIFVTPTHGEGRDATEVIKTKLASEGRISKEQHEFERLEKVGELTETLKQLPENYQVNQVIEFVQNVPGFEAGSRYDVLGKTKEGLPLVIGVKHDVPVPLPLDKAKDFDVFQKHKINIAEHNDLIRITKNMRSVEGHALSNGQIYETQGLTSEGHIRLSNGQTLHKNAMHIRSGFYHTSQGAQGNDRSLNIVSQSSQSLAASNDKQFYTTISRGIKKVIVYTDDKEALRDGISKIGDRMSAIELDGKSKKQKRGEEIQRQRVAEFMRRKKNFREQYVKPANENLKARNVGQFREFKKSMGRPGPDKG